MEIMNLFTPKNNEVVTYDFESNKVLGESISTEDTLTIISTLKDFNDKASVFTGFYLKALKEKAPIKELGYKDIYDLGKQVLGISKGVVSERIQVATRFQSADGAFCLDDKYKGFKYSALLSMKNLKDEEIESLGVTADSSYLEVREAVKALVDKQQDEKETAKLDEATKAEAPEKEKAEAKAEGETAENSSDSEQSENVSRETLEIDFTALPKSLQVALDKYMRANHADAIKHQPILAIDFSK